MANLLRGGKGRPLHPLLVHYPSALYPTSLLFDGLSHLAADGTPFVKGAFALIVTGLVVSVVAAAAGFADFLAIEGGRVTQEQRRHRKLLGGSSWPEDHALSQPGSP